MAGILAACAELKKTVVLVCQNTFCDLLKLCSIPADYDLITGLCSRSVRTIRPTSLLLVQGSVLGPSVLSLREDLLK